MKNLLILLIILLLTGCSYISTPSIDNTNENITTGTTTTGTTTTGTTTSGINYSGMVSTEIKANLSGEKDNNKLSKEIITEINKPEIFVNSGVGFSIKLPTKGDDKSKNILTLQGEGFDRRDINNRKTHNFIIVDVEKKDTNPCGQIFEQGDGSKSFTTQIKYGIKFTLSDVRFSPSGEEGANDYLGSICFEKGEYNISILVNEPVKFFYSVRDEIIDNIRLF